MCYVVVTGVSTGIGCATTKVLIRAGYHVFGSVRKEQDIERLKSQFSSSFTPLLFDVTDVEAIREAAWQVKTELKGQTLAGLINNAGVANHAVLMHQPIDEFRKVLEINLIGTLAVIQAFLPLLGATTPPAERPGRIINMSSISGKYSAPFVGAYCASKHALEGMLDSLRRELMLFGIDVVVIGPGYVATPIWDRQDIASSVDQYKGTAYAASLRSFDKGIVEAVKKGHTPEQVAKCVVGALVSRKPSTRYALVAEHFKNWTLPMWLPERWMDTLMAQTFLKT